MCTLFCISLDTGMRLICWFTLWFECKQRSLVARLIQKSVCILRPGDNLQNGTTLTQRRRYGALLLNKVVVFVLFPYKKYSHRFIMLRSNHWWQMEYPGDVFHTFLDLDSVIYLAVNGTITSLPVFIQNIINCVLNTNEAFTGLERHGGKWLMSIFSFWGGISL